MKRFIDAQMPDFSEKIKNGLTELAAFDEKAERNGLPRALSNRGEALVEGARVPIIGRISMDVTVVNITGVSGAGPGTVATLIGQDGDTAVSVDEVAAWADTISYEVLTGLTPRLPRIWA